MTQRYDKDPQAFLDFAIDWSSWLDDGETITISTWASEEDIVIEDTSHTSTTATVWLSGGTPNISYRVTNEIITNAGRKDQRSIRIRVVDR